MNLARSEQRPSRRFVTVGQGEIAYRAFVPAPLSPVLEYDAALVGLLSDADRALGELAGLARTVPNPHLLVGPFIRREAVLSSRIEWTKTELADLYAYELGQPPLPSFRPAPPEEDRHEMYNNVLALEHGLARLQDLPLSLRFIRELHERLLGDVRGEEATPGEFRRSQNWIGEAGSTLNRAIYVPPPPAEMHEALDAFERYLHAGEAHPPLLRLAFIHQGFEAIHPFLDGNGRIGRLLVSLLLVHWDLLLAPLLGLSAFFERRRQEYYDLLLAVNERSAWREWVTFFLRGVAEQSRDGVRRAKLLLEVQGRWRQRLSDVRASALLQRLADSLFEMPVLTIPRSAQLLGITERSARRNAEKLVNLNILRLEGRVPPGQPEVLIAGEVLRAAQTGAL